MRTCKPKDGLQVIQPRPSRSVLLFEGDLVRESHCRKIPAGKHVPSRPGPNPKHQACGEGEGSKHEVRQQVKRKLMLHPFSSYAGTSAWPFGLGTGSYSKSRCCFRGFPGLEIRLNERIFPTVFGVCPLSSFKLSSPWLSQAIRRTFRFHFPCPASRHYNPEKQSSVRQHT